MKLNALVCADDLIGLVDTRALQPLVDRTFAALFAVSLGPVMWLSPETRGKTLGQPEVELTHHGSGA